MGSLGQTPGVGAGPVGVGGGKDFPRVLWEPTSGIRGIQQPRHQQERHPGWMVEMRRMGNQGGKRGRSSGSEEFSRAQRETWGQ